MREIEQIYENTKRQFSEWGKSVNLGIRNVACAEKLRSTQYDWGEAGASEIGDKIGFSILWTPPIVGPEILLCGICAADFGSKDENEEHLSGNIPTQNIYINSKHKFGKTIERAFRDIGRNDLFENCVGMNMWHFQYIGRAVRGNFPIESVEFCEANTRSIIEHLKPKRIIALGGETHKVLGEMFDNVHKFFHPSSQHGIKFTENLHELLENEF